MDPAPDVDETTNKRKTRAASSGESDDPDYDPKNEQDEENDVVDNNESDSDSDWSVAKSDDLGGKSDMEEDDEEYDEDTEHKKARKETWRSLKEPWQRLGYFLEMGDRFAIHEKKDFYVVKRSSKQQPGYLANKAGLLEENGFYYSERFKRWQRPISLGKHDLETWRPEGHSYKVDGFHDEFDEFA